MTAYTTKISPQGSNAAMLRPILIVAGKNPIQRARMARMLSDGIAAIATTGSAACLMEMLLRGKRSIVVLSDGLEENLSFTRLIPLLKSCNPDLIIILASDDVSHSDELCIGQQGVFYRTNQPDCAEGWDELQLAVDCACNSALYATRPFHPCETGQGYEQPL